MTEASVSLLLGCSTCLLATVDIVLADIFVLCSDRGRDLRTIILPSDLVDNEVVFINFNGLAERG